MNATKITISSIFFTRAYDALNHASKCLDEIVESEIEKCKSREELLLLISILPKQYDGVERAYEKIHREYPDKSCYFDDCGDCKNGECTSIPLFDCPE